MKIRSTNDFFVDDATQMFVEGLGLSTPNAITQFAIEGEAGCGKTELTRLIAQTLWPNMAIEDSYTRVVMSRDTSTFSLLLDKRVENGDIIEEEQAFLKAIQRPGVVVLDEAKLASADVITKLNSLLDQDRFIVMENGIKYGRHPENLIILTSNPETYAGVKRQHGGFTDRLPTLQMTYSSREAEILKNRLPALGADIVARLVQLAELMRSAQKTKDMQTMLSTRGLILAGMMIVNGADHQTALRAILKVTDEEKVAVNELVRLVFGATLTTGDDGAVTLDLIRSTKMELEEKDKDLTKTKKERDDFEKKYNNLRDAIAQM